MWPKGELFSVREAAQRAGRDPETIRRWIWKGKLHAVKVGGQYLIPPSDLDDAVYFQEQQKAKTAVAEPAAAYTVEPEGLSPKERAELLAEIQRDWEAMPEEDLEAERALREELFREYGYFDVVQSVRDAREDPRG